MSFHYRYRKQIIIAVIIGVIAVATIIATIYTYEPKQEKKISSLKIKDNKEKTIPKKETVKTKYMVDIKGEVLTPGIYELEEDSRVIDVISQAGGLTENADTTVINLSKKIEDEMVIIVYSKWQVENWEETKEQEKYLQEQCISSKENQAKNDACIEEEESKITTTININTATKEELMTLSGIGEAKATSIIFYREKTPFTKIEDIKNVSGIGESVYEEIKNHITV